MDKSNPDTAPMALEITIEETANLLHSDNPPLILDVREASELAFCKLEECLHIPTHDIQFRWKSLPRDRHILVLCHHGIRSLFITRFLRDKGITNTQSIRGGIDAWSRSVDPTVPRY